jgi:hypothetical protein
VTGFRLGDVVTLREHERPCRVLDISDPDDRVVPTDGFCVLAVLIGPVDSDVKHGWVLPDDLALVSR